MAKHVNTLIITVFLALISFGSALRQADTGLNDWHLANIGAISNLYYAGNNRILRADDR